MCLRTANKLFVSASRLAIGLSLCIFFLLTAARAQTNYGVAFESANPPALNPRISSLAVLQQSGVRPRFSPDGSTIVFDSQQSGAYNVYLMDLNGNITESLTDGNSGIAQEANGNAMFDPSGKYIVFLSEDPNHVNFPGISALGNPGTGLLCNFWATDLKGSQFWQLTDIPIAQSLTDTFQGVVNPNFTLDGSSFVWTNRYSGADDNSWGLWRLMTAPYSNAGGPHLGNQRVLFQPTTGNYVTSMGFLDATHILAPGNLSGQNPYGMDENVVDTANGTSADLNNTPLYWEEGACISPNKEWIVYMDNITSPFQLNFSNPDWASQPLQREYWLMEANGNYKERLTYFNDPIAPEYLGNYGAGRILVDACDFAPDGTSIAATLSVDFGTATTAEQHLKIMKIGLAAPSMFTATGAPTLSAENAVVNAGSFQPQFASGGWISIFGTNLAPDTRIWRAADFASNTLPGNLDGVSVQINGKPAFVSFISPTQVNVLAPDDTAEGPVSIQLTTAGGSSQTITAAKQEFAPGWFTFPAEGGKYVAAQHANYSPVGSSSLYPGASTPAKPGETILLYGTGFGPTNPPLPAGQFVHSANPLSSPVTVEIGGVTAKVQYAGRSESGLDQLNVVVPQLSNGDHTVIAAIEGAQTQSNAYITVQN